MATWEARTKDGSVIGSFVHTDAPVPRVGETVMIMGVSADYDGEWQVLRVRHWPKDRMICVFVSPQPPSTAGYGETAMEEEA